MRILVIILGVIGLLVGLAAYGPGSLNAMHFAPPAPDPSLEARFASVQTPVRTERPDLHGAEDLEAGPDGRLYASLADGRIMARTPAGDWSEVAHTGGRPLGLAFAPDGRLFVADALRGLLAQTGTGWDVWLASAQDGGPLVFADDLSVLEDGRIILTDASLRHSYGHHMESFLEAEQTGRILAVTAPDTYTVLAEGLGFINGVDHDPASGAVFVNETWAGRIWRLDPDSGALSVLVDGLPGYPDNLEFDSASGLVWSGLQVAGLPALPDRPALAVALTPDGEIVHTLRGPAEDADGITTMIVWNGELWTAGLARDGLTVFPAPAP